MSLLVLIMIVSFCANLFMIDVRYTNVIKGFIPTIPESFDLIIAVSATTFSVAAAAFQSYLVRAKKWNKSDVRKGFIDSVIGTFCISSICIIIIITSATVLKPLEIKVNSALEMAMQLEPLLGSLSKWLFLFGLWAGAFSSFIANAMMGGIFLADGIGLGDSLNNISVKIISTIVLVVGTLIAVGFGKNPIELLIMAQGITVIVVPLIALVILLICNDRYIMGNLKNNYITNIIGIASFMWLVVLSYRQIISLLVNIK